MFFNMYKDKCLPFNGEQRLKRVLHFDGIDCSAIEIYRHILIKTFELKQIDNLYL